MASPYTSVTVSNYNANPPSDDGAAVAANRLNWSKHKTKIGDPLKTAIESINTNLGTAFGKVIGGAGITTTALTYGVAASDQGKLVNATAAGITVTTPDATVVTSPFVFGVLNSSSGDVTLDGSGTQTVNGSLSLTMKPGDGWLVFTDGTNWFVIGRKIGVLPRGYIDGCILSNGTDATNDINVAAGVCRDSTNTVDIAVAAMAGKQLDANWAPGAGAGMRNSAAGIANGTYHLYAVAKPDGTQDIYAHTSATVATVLAALQAETGGSAYTYACLIGSILREGAAIVLFVQHGDYFQRKTVAGDISQNTPGTSAVSRTLSVPTGIRVIADLFIQNQQVNNGTLNYVLISDLDTTDSVPGPALANVMPVNAVAASSFNGIATLAIRTNTSGQVRSRGSYSDANVNLYITTRGWWHQRGKDA